MLGDAILGRYGDGLIALTGCRKSEIARALLEHNFHGIYDWEWGNSFQRTTELTDAYFTDVFAFRGKIPGMLRPGASALLRVGLTYDRRWKPRYQPFF